MSNRVKARIWLGASIVSIVLITASLLVIVLMDRIGPTKSLSPMDQLALCVASFATFLLMGFVAIIATAMSLSNWSKDQPPNE